MEDLDRRAEQLMRASKAPSTWKKYQAEFSKFQSWMKERGYASMPASTKSVLRYLTYRSDGCLANSLATASAAISAFHKLKGFVSPCADPRVAALLEGARRTFSKPVKQKKPLTKEILRNMWISEVGDPSAGTLWQWRNCWLLNMMVRTCSRFADVCKLKRSNFMFTSQGMEVFFQFRKNDQRGVGHTVKIRSSEDEWCFVKLTERYFAMLKGISKKRSVPVVPKIRRGKKGSLTIFPNTVATDNSCRGAFNDALKKLGIDNAAFGLHSAKIGGVVHLRNSGISWRSINDYVGWAKDSVMPERYAKAACNKTDKMDNILSLYSYLSLGIYEA